jgi:stearoyl-CoA desaturase (delta-9 desaturase)
MDLLTPATKWAAEQESRSEGARESHDDHGELHEQMPPAQRLAMLLSIVVPILILITAIVLVWHEVPSMVGWPQIISMVVMYCIAGFGTTVGYHRLLTHRAFETPRWVRAMFAIFGSTGAQGAVMRWCATHRRHHQTSDHEGDPHSPHLHGSGTWAVLRGMIYAHIGWQLDADKPDTARSVSDLLADRWLMRVDQLYWLWVALGILLPGIFVGAWYGTWRGVVSGTIWGGFVRICLMQHVTWSINSVCHVWGTRPFQTSDHSANNWICAVLALGEGWHNNHHAFPTSARQGLRWWQFDSSWLVIKAMTAVGLAWNLRTPTESAMKVRSRSVLEASQVQTTT